MGTICSGGSSCRAKKSEEEMKPGDKVFWFRGVSVPVLCRVQCVDGAFVTISSIDAGGDPIDLEVLFLNVYSELSSLIRNIEFNIYLLHLSLEDLKRQQGKTNDKIQSEIEG